MAGLPQKINGNGDELVTLRGTTRGFELVIDTLNADGEASSIEDIVDSLRRQLSKSPSFFAGSDAIIQFNGHPVSGSLGPLEALAAEFSLTIVAVRSQLEERRETTRAALAVVEDLLEPEETDSIEVDFDDPPAEPEPEPEPETLVEPAPEPEAAPELLAEPAPKLPDSEQEARNEAFDAVRALALQAPDAAKIIIGPVRSGCILEATEHIIIVGDVNPGAEVTSIGSIVVLGRMRGIAHAGAGGKPAFIFALQLEPQQLRLGTRVARAGDSDGRALRPEIARVASDRIVVEPYAGRLPLSLASSLF